MATRGTPLPMTLRRRMEAASGRSWDHAQMVQNSPVPGRLDAEAVALADTIHLGPGGEQHLGHEAWHLIQQSRGQVAPTESVAGMAVNRDSGLEAEAEIIGADAETDGFALKPAPRAENWAPPNAAPAPVAQLARPKGSARKPKKTSTGKSAKAGLTPAMIARANAIGKRIGGHDSIANKKALSSLIALRVENGGAQVNPYEQLLYDKYSNDGKESEFINGKTGEHNLAICHHISDSYVKAAIVTHDLARLRKMNDALAPIPTGAEAFDKKAKADHKLASKILDHYQNFKAAQMSARHAKQLGRAIAANPMNLHVGQQPANASVSDSMDFNTGDTLSQGKPPLFRVLTPRSDQTTAAMDWKEAAAVRKNVYKTSSTGAGQAQVR